MTYWYWWILAAVLAIIEVFAPGAFIIWLSFAALFTGLLAWFFPLALEMQLLLFAVLSVVSALLGRIVMQRFSPTSDEPLLNQRQAHFIGHTYTVTEDIVNGYGRIRIGDTSWRVEGPDCSSGSKVRVLKSAGATLLVELL